MKPRTVTKLRTLGQLRHRSLASSLIELTIYGTYKKAFCTMQYLKLCSFVSEE